MFPEDHIGRSFFAGVVIGVLVMTVVMLIEFVVLR